MKPCVLVFAGLDPSGGAGLSADIQAIAAQGAHALPVPTTLTVQDNDHVFAVHPVEASLMLQQAQALINKIKISAIKIGIIANRANSAALAHWIGEYKIQHPHLPVILDPVLASGHGDLLSTDNAIEALVPLFSVTTLITPNLLEAARLCPNAHTLQEQAQQLLQGCTRFLSLPALASESGKGNCTNLLRETLSYPSIPHVLIKGGHSADSQVSNHWFYQNQTISWQWSRLAGAFHGSGCTLASAIAGQLACGKAMRQALDAAQNYCYLTLEQAYAIADGQRIPQRFLQPNSSTP
jgi:hydroxymethylpyrimidine/phosphomethylpyrimidine kinase